MTSHIRLSVADMTDAPESSAAQYSQSQSEATAASTFRDDLTIAQQDVDADEAGSELNPMWIVAIGLGCFFVAAALILAFG